MDVDHSLEITREQLVNDFAIRSFRDMADEDYITARMSYRAGLSYPSLWQSQQAIEKYLKCILLLNRIPAKQVRHDLAAALAKLEGSGKVSLDLKPASLNFIEHINEVGQYRYLEVSTSTTSRDVINLDRLVWELRRFCTLELGPRQLNLEQGKIAPRYQIAGGQLEKIASSKNNPARTALLVNNGFLGVNHKKSVRMRTIWQVRNAPLHMHPEILDAVLKYVFLPSDLVKAWREHEAPFYTVPPDS